MAIAKAAVCLTAAAALWGAEVKFAVRHDHLRKSCAGTLTVTDTGVAFEGAKKHRWTWRFEDIQQLTLSPGHIVVLTYRDNPWKLGADRGYEFEGEMPKELYALWSAKLDQRLVAETAEKTEGWSLPVKHLRRMGGSQGVLTFGADKIVFETSGKEESRTWRYEDIESISTSGPFQLTVTTFERAKSHYGDRKGFNFQLKRALDEARYNQLWLEIQKKNGRIQQ